MNPLSSEIVLHIINNSICLFSGHLFLQSAVIKELSKLTDAVVSLDRRMGRLEEKLSRKDESGLIKLSHNFPIFKTMDEYMNIDAHPKDMVSLHFIYKYKKSYQFFAIF